MNFWNEVNILWIPHILEYGDCFHRMYLKVCLPRISKYLKFKAASNINLREISREIYWLRVAYYIRLKYLERNIDYLPEIFKERQ